MLRRAQRARCRGCDPLREARHGATSPRPRGGGGARGGGEVRRVNLGRLRLGVGDSFGSYRAVAVFSCLLPPCSRLTGLNLVGWSNPPTALDSLGGSAARFWPGTAPHLSRARHGPSRPVPEHHKQSPGGQGLVLVLPKAAWLKEILGSHY